MGNWSQSLMINKNENNMEEQSSNAQTPGSGSGFAFNIKRRKSSAKQHPLFLSPDANKAIESSPSTTQHFRLPIVHPAPNKNQVPFLQPIAVRTIHSDPCVDIIYREDAIVTTDRRGRIRTWARPT